MFERNAYIRIGPDGVIHLISKGPEIGQGIKTAFPLIIAEEFDADWAAVRVEQAVINPGRYGRQSAGRSRSIPAAWGRTPLCRCACTLDVDAGGIRLAADKAGWGKRLPAGRGLGLGFHFSHAGHFAEVVEASVGAGKKLTVHRVTIAGDVGRIINLSGAENQCQGSVIHGLSTALGLSITLEDGRVQESNFDKYPLLRISGAPEVAVHFVDSDFAPTGLGEPALCNAVFAATGERVRTLPLTQAGFSV